METEGLREKKKQATRRWISDVASGLFALRGFDQVTIAEVAEAADVAKKTVTNYFPRKEDLFFDRQEDRLSALEEVIRERAANESVLTVMRRYQHELLAAGHPLSGAIENIAPFISIIRASPALLNRAREMESEIEQTLARVLTAEVADDLRARLVAKHLAGTVTTIFDTAVDRMLAGNRLDDVRRDQVAVIEEAFTLLAQGIGDYGARH